MIRTHEIRLTELDAVRLERALMELLKASDGEPQGAGELESLLDAAAIVPTPDSASASPKYLIQAGAFLGGNEAEALKARIAMTGEGRQHQRAGDALVRKAAFRAV